MGKDRGDSTITNKRKPSGFLDRFAMIVSSGFYIGYIPFAPATFASFGVLMLYFIIPEYLIIGRLWPVMIGLFFLGVWTSTRCESIWGKDPGKVIIDEVVGMMLTLMLVPWNWKTLLCGFFLFRVYDILKPQPVRYLERFPRGWGIMMDDIMAGVYSNITLRIILIMMPWWNDQGML